MARELPQQGREPVRERGRPQAERRPAAEPQHEPDEQMAGGRFYEEFYDEEQRDDADVLAEMIEVSRRKAGERPQPVPPREQRRDRETAAPVQASARMSRNPEPPSSPDDVSDFERVLEEEMAMQISQAQRAAQSRPPTAPQSHATPSTPAAARAAASPSPQRPLPQGSRTAAEPRPSEPRGNPEQWLSEAQERRQAAMQAAANRQLPPSLARPATASRPAPPAPQPQRMPVTADVGGRTAAPPVARPPAQPNLQREIARIFGEISTKRGGQ